MLKSRQRRFQVLCFLIIIFVFLTIRHARKYEPLGLDQGLFCYFGQHIPQGELPYRDIWDSKPPGIFYTYTVASRILGSSSMSVYLLDTFWTIITGLLLYFIVRRRFDTRIAIAATLVYSIFSNAPQFGGFWSTAQAEVFIGLPLIIAWYLVSQSRWKHYNINVFIIGCLLGITILFKIATLLLLAFYAGSILVFLVKDKKKSLFITLIPRSLVYMIGCLFLPVIVMLYFAWRGALNEMIDALTLYQIHYLKMVTQGQNLLQTTFYQISNFVKNNLTVSALSLVGCIHIVWKRRSTPSILLVLWYIAAFAAIWMQRQFAGYHFILILLPASILTGYGFVTIVSSPLVRKWSFRREASIILILLLVFIDAKGYYSFYTFDIEYMRKKINYDEYLQSFDMGAISYENDRLVAEYLNRRTSQKDYILVWGLAPAIYFLSGRTASTKFVFHHVLLTESSLSISYPGLEKRREEFMEELEAKKPKYIVIGMDDSNGFEPEDSYTQMLAFPRFKEYVISNYKPEAKIGKFLIAGRTI